MKLKNSKENVRLQSLFPIMYGGVLLLVILRSLQMAKFIDSETGFLIGGEFVVVLLYGVIAVLCLYFVAVSFLSADAEKIELACLKNKTASIVTAVFGVSLICDSFFSFFNSIEILNGVSVGGFSNGAETFKTLMATGTLPYALQSLFALVSSVYIFILVKSFSTGKAYAHKHKYLALAPIVWSAFKIITRFVKQISYIKVSDLFLELIMLAFMILFFVAFAQVTSGVYSDDSRWRITALGLSSALVSLTVNVPRLIFTVFAGDFVNKEYPFNFADTAFAVFAVVVAFAAVKSISAGSQKAD